MPNLKENLWFWKWHEEYGKFSPEHLKFSKIGTLMESLIWSRKCMSLKSTEELCVRTMKNGANLKKNWRIVSKLTWGIWWILTRTLKSLNHLDFNGLFLKKVYNVWVKRVHRSYGSWHWRVMQNLTKKWLEVWKMTWAL